MPSTTELRMILPERCVLHMHGQQAAASTKTMTTATVYSGYNFHSVRTKAKTSFCNTLVIIMCSRCTRRFGKRFITTHKMSPDAFVQMGIVYGYYSLYGEVVAAYEPVLTKVRLLAKIALRSAANECTVYAWSVAAGSGASSFSLAFFTADSTSATVNWLS